MRAIRQRAYGGPQSLRYDDAPKPSAKAGEVLGTNQTQSRGGYSAIGFSSSTFHGDRAQRRFRSTRPPPTD